MNTQVLRYQDRIEGQSGLQDSTEPLPNRYLYSLIRTIKSGRARFRNKLPRTLAGQLVLSVFIVTIELVLYAVGSYLKH